MIGLAAVVDQTKFPVGIDLIKHGTNTLVKIDGLYIVNRNNNTDFGLIGKPLKTSTGIMPLVNPAFKVVAKGMNLIADRIREIAFRHGIPTVENKPLARTLYRTVEVGAEVPPALYRAVAEVLSYVYRLRGKL